MIDTNKQRAECARLQTIVDDSLWLPGTSWPALIKAHLEALDEIERMRAAGKFLAQGVPPFERRMHDAYEAACRVFEEGA